MPNMYNDPGQPSAFGTMLTVGGFVGLDMAYNRALGLVPNSAIMRTGGNIANITQPARAYQVIRHRAPMAGPLQMGEVRPMIVSTTMSGKPANLATQREAARGMGGWFRSIKKGRARRRLVGSYSSKAWSGFFGGGTGMFDFKGKFKAAGQALEGLPGVLPGKAPIWRALAAGPLGFLSSYMIWGSMIPAAVDLGLGIFNEAAAEGRRLRGGTPETVSKQYDMATRQQAFTMRQASMMAMHMSQTGVRAAIGNEASFLH